MDRQQTSLPIPLAAYPHACRIKGVFMGFLKNLDDWLAKLFTLAIVLITILAVFMRYILNDPLQWVEEVLIALYLWAIMFGAASSMKVRGHVSIDALVGFLPQKVQRYVQHLNDVLGIVVLVTFGWLGLQLAMAADDNCMRLPISTP